jgi:LPXTG-site transpeptidase (sortase) family protein
MSVGDTLFFVANDGTHGIELWKSQPPWEDAEMVEDIRPGAGNAEIANLTAMGTTLFFTANDGSFGNELWRSVPPYDDVTTQRISDIYRGGGSSSPGELTALGRTLFFNANRPDEGIELWRFGSEYGLPRTGFAPGQITRLPAQPPAQAYQNMNSMRIDLPILSQPVDLVGVPIADDGWNLTWLGRQAGYLTDSAFPTLPGNTVITGHAYLPDGTPGPFAKLEQLRWGDQIVLHAWGQRYLYEVRTVQQVAEDDMSVLGHKDLDWITLLTCKGYDEASDTYLWRTAVQAVLVRVEPEP